MRDLPLHVQNLESKLPGHRVLRLDGPLTLPNLFECQDLVRSDRATSLILDLASVPYVDSAGVGCLVNGYVSHQNAGRALYLVGVTPRVRTTLRVTNVEQFFPIFATLEEAERGITS